MAQRKGCVFAALVFFSVLLLAEAAQVQMDSMYRFRGVKIPVSLVLNGTVTESGPFDLEFLVARDSGSFCLRLIKKGKILGHVQGREWAYGGDEKVPGKPTLKMTRDTGNSALNLVFEAGKDHLFFPLVRAEFSIPYVEET